MILAAVVLLVAGGLFLLQKQYPDATEGMVVIYQEKEKTAAYPLAENKEIEICDADGESNRLVIDGGEAWIAEADCPDGLCMKQGRISKEGQSIICLPHKLVVVIEAGKASDVDAVAW